MKKMITKTVSFSPLVKKILFFLALGIVSGSSALFGKGYSSIPNNKMLPTDYMLADADPIRLISEDEFNGVTPIILDVNDQVAIPFDYEAGLDNLPHSFTCQIGDTNLMSAELFDAGTVFPFFKINALLMGLASGQTTFSLCYDTQVIKSFNVSVIDATASSQQ